MKGASLRWMFALGLVFVSSLANAQVYLAGRLTAPVSGDQLVAGSQTPSVSPDGRYVAFVSSSNNLGQPSNGTTNVYLYDLVTDEYLLATAGLGTGNSTAPSVAEGGFALAFQSQANDLVGGGTSGVTDLFYSEAYDAGQGEVAFSTYLVSKGLAGAAPNGASQNASISADGHYVAFLSEASNLIANDTNGAPDIFVADASNLFATPPERVSVTSGGAQIEGYSSALSPSAISSDGRFVAFAVNENVSIDGSSTGNLEDVFVRDRVLDTTNLISKSSAGVAASSSSDMAAISPSGRFVVFRSFASNLVASPSGSRIYLRDRQEGTTSNMPLPPNAASCEDPRVSDYAEIVAQCNMNSGSAQAFLYRPGAVEDAFYQLSTSLSDGPGDGASGELQQHQRRRRRDGLRLRRLESRRRRHQQHAGRVRGVPEPGAASAWLAATGRARRVRSSRWTPNGCARNRGRSVRGVACSRVGCAPRGCLAPSHRTLRVDRALAVVAGAISLVPPRAGAGADRGAGPACGARRVHAAHRPGPRASAGSGADGAPTTISTPCATRRARLSRVPHRAASLRESRRRASWC